jgi:ATP-binding cassette subfamily B protein
MTDHSPPSTTAPTANVRWLWGFVWQHKRAALGALISGLLAGAAQAYAPYLSGTIVDHIGMRAESGIIIREIGGLLGLGAFSVLMFAFQRHYSGVVAYSTVYTIRLTLFDNLLKLDQSFYQRYALGDLLSRMHADIDMIWRLLVLTFLRVGSATFTLILSFVLLATISLPLTAIVFIVLTISTAFQVRAGLRLATLFEDVQAQQGVMSAFVQDAFSGIQTIKTFAREPGAAARYAETNAEFRRRWLHFKRRNEPIGMLPNFISELTAGIVVIAGGVLTLSGQLTLGDFARFLLSLSLIATVLLHLATTYQRLQQARGALFRLTPLLQPPRIEDAGSVHGEGGAPAAFRGDIVFDDVGVQIDQRWVLRHISLHIPAGAVIGFVGPTGGGKTLLLSLIARVIDPNEGHVLLDGIDVRQLPLDELRAAIAYVPQQTFLFSQPLAENVRMGHEDIEAEELMRALHISRMSSDLAQLPQGLETLVGEKGVMLSGGQRQRVAIARAILRDPSVLVLDDALSSVDTQTAADILHDLRQVLRSRTSLIVAHRMATVKDADHIVVMDKGRLVEQGSHLELLAKGGMYAAMVAREQLDAREDVDAAAASVEAGD